MYILNIFLSHRFYKHGSLKDVLCMSTPKNPFLSKYGNPKGRTALSMKQVATYGKQILETLIFLHSKGYAYGMSDYDFWLNFFQRKTLLQVIYIPVTLSLLTNV